MSIHDFYSQFVSTEEKSSLLGTLRRLSLFEDPKTMFNEDPLVEWNPWSGAELTMEGAAL